MYVRFWGTRGSIPTPGTQTAQYGGNTSCTELRTDDGTTVILDCGTGARELGIQLLRSPLVKVHILITHTHWDHIQGFPFFAPGFRPDTEVTIYGPAGFLQNLEQAMAGQMQYSYFPVTLEEVRSRLRFVTVEEGTFNIDSLSVSTQYLNHTTPTVGYRLTSGGATLVYATDHEPFSSPKGTLLHPGDERHMAFLQNADLVIHDAQYTTDEYPKKLGWGHSTMDYAAEVAMGVGAARLALFHHDPTHTDSTIERLEAAVRANVAARRSDMEVFSAREGMELYLPESGSLASKAPNESALERRPLAGTRVLIAADNADYGTQIANVLRQDGLHPIIINQNDRVLAASRQLRPGIVILDAALFGSKVFSVARSINADSEAAPIPIILLSTDLDEAALRRAQAAGITDCLAVPFSPPMLHARVRSWLTRFFQPVAGGRNSVVVQPQKTSAAFGEVAPLAWAEAATGQEAAIPVTTTERTTKTRSKTVILADIPLFGLLPQKEIAHIAGRAKLRDYAAGESIIQQGGWGESLYAIASGRVRVIGKDASIRSGEILLAELGQAEVFGELSLLDEAPHTATVRAVTRTRCLVIPVQVFRNTIQAYPAFSLRLLRVLSRRLQLADTLLIREGPDAVTGLMTLRTFRELYRREATFALRHGYNIALVIVTLENLADINERHGYAMGDEALRAVADGLRSSVRSTDYLARSKGDQFLVLLADTGSDGPTLVSTHIHHTLEETAALRGLPVHLSCNIQYVAPTRPPSTFDDLLELADTPPKMQQQQGA